MIPTNVVADDEAIGDLVPPAAEPSDDDDHVARRERMPTLDAGPVVAEATSSGAHTIAGVSIAGTVIAERYLVGPAIGNGGHGAVYRATHLTLDLPVAVKVLGVSTLTEAQRDELTVRFAREARTIAGIRHRNVLAIHDAGLLPNGSPYLVTELIEGEDLEQRIARGALSIPAVVDLGLQLFSALTAIAEGGVLHRDVKPANVMMHRESDAHVLVKLIDFGIARPAEEVTRLTVTGQILGTPHYMSPEQLRGERLDVRADLYAASAVLYEALTGAPPFDGPTAPIVIGKILAAALEPVLRRRPDCPLELATLVERCLSRSSTARPAHPLEVVNALGLIAQRAGLPTGPLAWTDDEAFGRTAPLSLRRVRALTPVDAPEPSGAADATTAPPGAAGLPRSPRTRRAVAIGVAVSALALGTALWVGSGDRTSAEVQPVAVALPAGLLPAPAVEPAAVAPAAPVDVAPLLRRGLESLARGETDEALASYRAACTADPNSSEAQRGRGLASSLAGLDGEAIRAFERYLALAPDAPGGARVRDRLRALRARRGEREQRTRH